MKQFIREHPWRLEIVPVALLTMLTCAVIRYRLEYHFLLPVSVVSLMFHVALNHTWAKSERRAKRFNWRAFNLIALLIIAGVLSLESAAPILRKVWIAIGCFGFLAQVALEYTRRPLPASEPGSADSLASRQPALEPNETVYYRETPASWRDLLVFAGIGMWMAFSMRSLTNNSVVAVASFVVIMLPAIILHFRRAFIITNERIILRLGVEGALIPMTYISKCSIRDYNPIFNQGKFGIMLKTYDGMRLFQWVVPPTRAVVVETIDGKKYLFTPVRPEKVLAIIQAILAAHTQPEAAQ